MSRTIRRKNETWEHSLFVDAWYTDYEHEIQAIKVDCSKGYAKRSADYHSDKYDFHAPKDFRQSLNREFRAKNKAILGHAIRTEIDPIFIPFIKNADWNYF